MNTIKLSIKDIGRLDNNQLKGFKSYKYSCIDTNPVGTYITHPFFNWLIEFFPRWIAPNVITFTGFLFIISSFLLLSYYDYGFYASSNTALYYNPVPRWVFAIVSYCIFVAYTLDGIDGKQARRTNTSGPLGELFDHGLDSWTTVFIPILLYSIFGRSDYSLPPNRIFYICLTVFVNFYLAHAEKYYTGTLYLPWSYDFAMLGSIIIFFVAFLVGHNGMKIAIHNQISLCEISEIVFYVSAVIFNIPMVLRCFEVYRNGTGKKRISEALRPLISFSLFLILYIIWVYYSQTGIVDRDPRIFCLTSGNIFTNICCQLIISQMSNTKCQKYNIMLLPLGTAVFLSILIPPLEILILYALFFISLSVHIFYGIRVVQQMCDLFNIHCFLIG